MVSLTRPIYSGKDKLWPKALGSYDLCARGGVGWPTRALLRRARPGSLAEGEEFLRFAELRQADNGLRVDLLVEDQVVVELKSVETLVPAHGKQVLTYLRLLDLPLGLLINFGAATMKEGLRRIVNPRTRSVC